MNNLIQCKMALVVEGGAMRSIFSAGLLDAFIQQQFNPFDFYIGVSAGAYNLLAYLTGEQKKSLYIFKQFACTKDFINPLKFIRGGHLIDLDWLENIAFSESHINTELALQNKKPLYVCLTDVLTGQAIYIPAQQNNIKSLIKASAALPLFYREFPVVNQRAMTDGGVANGIPVAEAIRLGAKKIMLIRARHSNYQKKDSYAHKLIRWKMRHHTQLLETMNQRLDIFQNNLDIIRRPPQGVEIIEICPPENFNLKLISRNKEDLIKGYLMGYESAGLAIQRWQQ